MFRTGSLSFNDDAMTLETAQRRIARQISRPAPTKKPSTKLAMKETKTMKKKKNTADELRRHIRAAVRRASDSSASFAEILKAAEDLVADPKTDPDDREKLRRMLEAVSKFDGDDAATARAILKRATEREEMRGRMGLPSLRAAVRREGNSVVFGVMTPEQARSHLGSGR
jgi:hypothetical protein